MKVAERMACIFIFYQYHVIAAPVQSAIGRGLPVALCRVLSCPAASCMWDRALRARMPTMAAEFSAMEVKRLQHPGRSRNVLFPVGRVAGHHLQITPSGGRTWLLRVTGEAKRREICLDGYPDVTLAMVRDRAREAKDQMRRGIDPVEERKVAKAALIAAQHDWVAERSLSGQHGRGGAGASRGKRSGGILSSRPYGGEAPRHDGGMGGYLAGKNRAGSEVVRLG